MVFADERHPAYDHLDARKIMGERNGTQVGDPKKGGKAIYQLAVLEDPPLRVVIGSDAYKVRFIALCDVWFRERNGVLTCVAGDLGED